MSGIVQLPKIVMILAPKLKRFILFTLGLVVSIAALVILKLSIDFKTFHMELKSTDWWLFPIVMLVYLIGFPLRGLRWKLMLPHFKQVSLNEAIKAVCLGYAGNNVLPLRGGELVRMEYFARKTNIKRVTVLLSIAAERTLDGLALIAILAISMMSMSDLLPSAEWISVLVQIIPILFGGVFLSLIVLRLFGNKILEWVAHQHGTWTTNIHKLLTQLIDALLFLRLDSNGIIIGLLSLIIWVIEGLTFVIAIQMSLQVSNPFQMAYLALAVVNFGILIPSSPGYVGVFQGMVILVFSLWDVPTEAALTTSLIVHAGQYIPIVVLGMIIALRESLWSRPRGWWKLHRV